MPEITEIRKFNGSYLPCPQSCFSFDEDQKYSIEIGAGVGLHACVFAKNNPDFQHIAIERTKEKFKKLNNRCEKESLDNLFAFHDDGVNWLYHLAKNQKFEKIFLLYPNPYPKNASYRWVRMPFFRELLKHLSPKGEIVFASNEKFYMDEVEDYCENYWDLHALQKKTLHQDSLEDSYEAITHFERKYLERGQTCYHYHYGFKDLSEKL